MTEDIPPSNEHPEMETDSTWAGNPAKSSIPVSVVLAVVVMGLLGVVAIMMMRAAAPPASADSAALSTLKAEYNALREEYNKERVAMGLRPIEGQSEPIEDIAARLKKDSDSLVALAGSYQSLMTEKESELTARNAEILRGEKLRANLVSENTRLQGEVQTALAGSADGKMARQDLADAKAQYDAVYNELKAAREKIQAMSGSVPQDDFADLKRRLAETTRAKEFFEARVKELEGDASKVKLFASSENELLPSAVELFHDLRKLENKSNAEISSSYTSLGTRLGANVLKKVTFATGSSNLTPGDEATIRDLVAAAPDGDLLMAIGYASETGNVDSNQTLSSERATAVARLIESVKRPDQLTQAVYLGQTDRFSSQVPESNQIVEIWHVRKK